MVTKKIHCQRLYQFGIWASCCGICYWTSWQLMVIPIYNISIGFWWLLSSNSSSNCITYVPGHGASKFGQSRDEFGFLYLMKRCLFNQWLQTYCRYDGNAMYWLELWIVAVHPLTGEEKGHMCTHFSNARSALSSGNDNAAKYIQRSMIGWPERWAYDVAEWGMVARISAGLVKVA